MYLDHFNIIDVLKSGGRWNMEERDYNVGSLTYHGSVVNALEHRSRTVFKPQFIKENFPFNNLEKIKKEIKRTNK